ncbi:nucleoside recognition protein [Paenibacillus sp. LHD-117]|uniref:nucleoside recognition domain-containing protein n=1 Tax=Paenibacillus sp. LHD-117 TaxID=3071412 RepID=UPI0027E0A9DA|nr:nucleoside recognition domain-containing protein [Paenibacillus sp. LHD-117]MDQ6419302.1 nucleoside recognition protein [Paenibacillus sp. LHD-117]
MAKTITLAILSILLVGSIITQPDASFQASLKGLTVWWNIVFPGLLPFLVLYEIMLAFGLAHGMGALLRPTMNRLFRLPGEAALPVVLGWLGGYPAGAEAVASLRKRDLISRSQGQQLLAYAHMPNPLFMLVIVGAGFLHKPLAGVLVAGAVWVSALWLLFLSSLFRIRRSAVSLADQAPKESANAAMEPTAPPKRGLLRAAASAMQEGRERDGRSFGKVLGDSVTVGVQKLMMIGGFMIIASMLAKLAEPLYAPAVKLGLTFFGPAFFEGHLGAYAAAVWELPGTDVAMVCAVIAAVLAWGGLSGILQTGYSVAGTGLKLLPFALHRLNHALHAFLLTLLLWKPVGSLVGRLAPNASFPVISGGEYHASSFGIRFPAEAVTAGQLHGLWPYAAGTFVVLFSLAIMAYLLLRPFTSANRSSP